MARKAVIEGGVVENVIEAGDDFTLPGKTLVTSDTAQIGDTYANGTFTPPTPPPVPIPQSVTPLQARKAINAAGLRSSIEAAVAASGQDAQDAWEYATVIERNNSIIASMAAGLGLTSTQIDDLFRTAATL